MRVHVHRTSRRLLEALQTAPASCYAIFARSTLDPAVLRESEAIARTRGHRDLTAARDLHPAAERLLREFFERAAQGDRERRFAYSSRVLLAVPDYPDLALLFVLRALKASAPESSVHLLIEDGRLAALAKFEAEGGPASAFHAGWRRAAGRGARSLARHAFSGAPPSGCDVLIFTLGDNPARSAPDAYFGDLAAALAAKCRVLTVYAAPGPRVRFPRHATALPLEAFLTPRDAMRAWSVSKNASAAHDAAGEDGALVAFLRAREQEAGEVFAQALMASAFGRMLAALKPRTLVYPFENRNWEKHLLQAARRRGTGRCIGYQHSSITPRHLAFTGAVNLSDMDRLPDAIVTCGEITAELIEARMPQARGRVSVGAALRARRLSLEPPAAWGLLAPISSSRAEAWEILRLLHALGNDGATPVIVRTHPTIPIDDLYAHFQWPTSVRLSRGASLADDLAATSLVAYSSSTVALEGMLYGRLPIYLDIGDIPSGNPIDGEHPFVFRAGTGAELRETIARIRGFSDEAITSLREQARAYAERYLIEPTPQNVERMAETIVRC